MNALPRTQEVHPGGMDVGLQIWREYDHRALESRLAVAQARGMAAVVNRAKEVNRYGQWTAVIKVLDPIALKRWDGAPAGSRLWPFGWMKRRAWR